MRPLQATALTIASLVAIMLCLSPPAQAELADVYLKTGVKLRGVVTPTDDGVLLSNDLGQLRLSWAEVERVVPLGIAPADGSAAPPPPSPTTRRAPPTTRPVATGRVELPPAPLLSDADIQRLKMQELRLDGPPEPVRVRFLRKGRQRDLPLEVLDELRQRPAYCPEWEDVLVRGPAHEKLQLIARETGTQHAERVVIESDPAVFATFRRRVLPLVNRSCARSGCHGGPTARLFRVPGGSPRSDNYAYTMFLLLDQMETEHGPLLDRQNPDDSVLLDYFLPQKGNERAHPPVGRGPTFQAAIRDSEDVLFTTVLNWINALRVPHPDYDLSYVNPYAGRLAPATETVPSELEEAPPFPAPTTHPTDHEGS